MKFEQMKLSEALQKSAQHCLQFVIGAASSESAAFTSLKGRANPLFRRQEHSLIAELVIEQDGCPTFVVSWDERQITGLERRWLLQKLTKRASQFANARHWRVLLDDGCTKEHLAMAEDIYRHSCDTLDGNSRLEQFSVIAADWNNLDAYRDVRLCHQIGYSNWVNANPDEMTSIEIGRQLESFATDFHCDFSAMEVSELKEKGLNLLLAVGQASERSPSRLLTVTHRWPKHGDGGLMLVGKGITFDTGGINVKAHENLVNCMKNDMGGAALMAHVFMALVESGYDKPLALVIPTCENLVDGLAMKPGSVVTSYSGKRVMIEHTDAEGRLILADALSYASEVLRPEQTLVAATLTTAALRQFSNFFTPVHFAQAELRERLSTAAQQWGEGFTFWNEFLPFQDSNQSKLGDLTNMGRMPRDSSMGGGSNVAAHFLKEFCPGPMVHFDIFATAWNWSGDYPGAEYGATGAPFNSLFQALRLG